MTHNAETAPTVWGQKCGPTCPSCGGCDWLRTADGAIPDFGSVCVRCHAPEPSKQRKTPDVKEVDDA